MSFWCLFGDLVRQLTDGALVAFFLFVRTNFNYIVSIVLFIHWHESTILSSASPSDFAFNVIFPFLPVL